MVTINFTIVVELVLFLVFLWGTKRFILNPVMQHLDDREQRLVEDHERADADERVAEEIEQKYAQAMAEARRESEQAFRHARQEAMREHDTKMERARDDAERAVAEARREAERRIDRARPELEAKVPELARLIRQQLQLEESVVRES